jgi:hypothetical protein
MREKKKGGEAREYKKGANGGGGEEKEDRWRQRESNPNQITCKARALPIKLCPQPLDKN